jgi:hypothetical protein
MKHGAIANRVAATPAPTRETGTNAHYVRCEKRHWVILCISGAKNAEKHQGKTKAELSRAAHRQYLLPLYERTEGEPFRELNK